MDPDQGQIGDNRYVGISLAKLRLGCRSLTYPQLFPLFALRGDAARGLVQEG